jgi:hypothetical protein
MLAPLASPKIRSDHLARPAIIYVRQSTLAQVREHTASTARQYDLVRRARELGWPPEAITVIDQDQGRSGASAAGRDGFQTLVAEVGLGHAGAVLSLEASRLARASSDWYRLLELCALTQTLVVDEDGVYDPGQYDDRLLLGFKGPAAYSTPCSTSRFGRGARRPARRCPRLGPGMFGAALPAVAAAQVADVHAGEGMSEGGPPPLLIEPPGDLDVADVRRQLPNQGERRRWRRERPVARSGPVHLDGGDRAGAPVDLDPDLTRVGPAIEVHARDSEAEELLALAVSRRLGVPDRWQILRQCLERGALLVGERHGGFPLGLSDGVFKLRHPRQGLLPAPFQLSGD